MLLTRSQSRPIHAHVDRVLSSEGEWGFSGCHAPGQQMSRPWAEQLQCYSNISHRSHSGGGLGTSPPHLGAGSDRRQCHCWAEGDWAKGCSSVLPVIPLCSGQSGSLESWGAPSPRLTSRRRKLEGASGQPPRSMSEKEARSCRQHPRESALSPRTAARVASRGTHASPAVCEKLSCPVYVRSWPGHSCHALVHQEGLGPNHWTAGKSVATTSGAARPSASWPAWGPVLP